MQNLSIEFKQEISYAHEIALPAKNAKFNWLDVVDIGDGIAQILTMNSQEVKPFYVIKGRGNLSLYEMAELLKRLFLFRFPTKLFLRYTCYLGSCKRIFL